MQSWVTILDTVAVLAALLRIPRKSYYLIHSKSVFVMPLSLFYYLTRFRELSSDEVSLRQYLFTASVRHLSHSLHDRQLQFLLSLQHNWTTKPAIERAKNLALRKHLCQDVEGQLFRAVWIVKHSSVGSNSKVLFWIHGKFIIPLWHSFF
jgi:hypothetical protein